MSRIGILGGMGPSATVDFMDKLVQLTPATRDQDHLPVIVASLPHVPDRSSAILGTGADPLPALLANVDLLNHIGVGVVAIPCNSSHHWYPQIAERSRAPVIHIAQCCVAAVAATPRARVAVLATRGALASGFYQSALRERGIAFFVPDSTTGQHDVDACIRAVKAGDVPAGTAALDRALAAIAAAGATAVIMGCTEIPIAARAAAPTPLTLVDSSLELARATVAFALDKGWNRPAWVS
ncbi:aspartate racemase [Variovorax sp. KBW07]|uniref:aspartate/glutamate racemase family protein n=1 Tax=Variovorax sp. KBW07 TaxID=2153358 RepID=UPI000F5717D8|nr:amino acid racemase [Variovorax sp. KBW07]RQO56985.1 aspartate racemase [Variovorax sp. KBW07]